MTSTSDGGYALDAFISPLVSGRGRTINIPNYGNSGVLKILAEDDSEHVLAFNNTTIYDKTKQEWHSQMASGDLPQARSDLCAVGMQGIGSDSLEM